MFSGSYRAEDVTFLLKPVQLAATAVADKERLIQSGRRHYSEMIGPEHPPAPAYLHVFHQALAQEKDRFARDLLVLARHLAARPIPEITLVSLARAGTPVGVLLGRTLRCLLGRPARHFSVSIIRDRGIDAVALAHILTQVAAESIVFVDGWTGKGVIAAELRRALGDFHERHGVQLDAGLVAVADLCGAAAFAATADDYLIPSSVLGATVSGLVSRSILNAAVVGPGDFHGCLYYEDVAADDLSRWFVDQVYAAIERQVNDVLGGGVTPDERARLRRTSAAFLADMQRRFGTRNVNHVKPGLGEATRVLLRRVPDRVLVRDPGLPEVAHLMLLARAKDVPVVVDPTLPYTAAALIKELDG
jgi:hypothetical protein